MVLRLIDAHGSKPGSTIMIEGEAYSVRVNDISKTGKHGASKCRIEAISIFTGKKKVIAVAGSERFEVPLVEQHKAQVLSVSGDNWFNIYGRIGRGFGSRQTSGILGYWRF